MSNPIVIRWRSYLTNDTRTWIQARFEPLTLPLLSKDFTHFTTFNLLHTRKKDTAELAVYKRHPGSLLTIRSQRWDESETESDIGAVINREMEEQEMHLKEREKSWELMTWERQSDRRANLYVSELHVYLWFVLSLIDLCVCKTMRREKHH